MADDRTDETLDDPPNVTDLDREEARVRRALEPDPRVSGVAFGLAWLIGYGALWLGITGRGPGWLTPTVGGITLMAALVIALTTFAVHTAMRTSGVRGPSAVSGAMYSTAWPFVFAGLFLVLSGAAGEGIPDQTFSLLWATLAPFAVGVLLIASAAFWRDRVQYATGVWILATAGVASIAGYPEANLVMSLAGGGGFLVAAVAYTVIQHRSPGVPSTSMGS